MQQADTFKFIDIFERCTAGETELHCDSLGSCIFVGISKQGDAVLQTGEDDFTTIPELAWNMMNFVIPFQSETHVRFIKQDDLNKLHEGDSFDDVILALKEDMLYEYEVTLNIRKVYDENISGGH